MQIRIKLNDTVSQKQVLANTPVEPRCGSSYAESYQALRELRELIGLDSVKEIIYQIQAYARISRIRFENRLCAEPVVLHSVFSGNPGTGKTTVARLLAKLYCEMGILNKGHMVEVERADLVGEYIGHTAQKTKEQVKKSLGGVLFIDEAYSLCRGGEKDFGREAIDVLVKAMEDYKTGFVLILAGYNDEMHDFLRANPGLNSRLPIQIFFPDYSVAELLTIADMMYYRREYHMDASGSVLLRQQLEKAKLYASSSFGNARTVRNIIEASLRMQAVRLIRGSGDYGREALQSISAEDINRACKTVLKTEKDINAEQDKKQFTVDYGG